MNTSYIKGLNNRLEIIRNLIAIGEPEEIHAQVKKLRFFAETDEIAEIISLLEQNEFHDALRKIDHFIQSGKQVVTVDESELVALRMELTSLEYKLAEIEEKKASFETKVKEFQFHYQKNLGSLIEELLRLKRDRLAKESKSDSSKTAEYSEAKKNYSSYQETMSGLSKVDHLELDSEDKARLRKAFRKACKLCHPDMVPDEQKQKAQSIFIELREAYGKNDITRVLQILKHLEEGKPLTNAAATDDLRILKLERDRLKEKIALIEREIKEIKESDIYHLIETITNLEGYFTDKREELNIEIDLLKREVDARE